MGNPITANTPAGTAAIRGFYRNETWIEGRSEDQISEVAAWPGMKAIAAFPDLHPGRFGPVGAAFLADRIWPQLVGPDIGCGMLFGRLTLPRHRLRMDKAIRNLSVLSDGAGPEEAIEALKCAGIDDPEQAFGQGSIGGGNHFCEVQLVDEILDPPAARAHGLSQGDLCLLIHSGSRDRGARIFNGIEASWSSGFLNGGPEADDYLRLHDQANIWARVNRLLIAKIAAEALGSDFERICDAPHNHVELTAEGWLHRKGAARPDNGLAPLAGSRDTPSYLVSVPDTAPASSLASLSHGAGRRYDRSSMHGRIRKTRSDLEALKRNRYGGRVVCEDRDLLLEEAGSAYKNPEQVMSDLNHFGIANAVCRMTPLITWKTEGGRK